MKVPHSLIALFVCSSLASGTSPETSAGRYLDPSQALTEGFLRAALNQNAAESVEDTLGIIDITSPDYKYPGKAMLRSLAVPGTGQFYAGKPKRAFVFLGVEVLTIATWNRYFRLGNEKTEAFQDSANEQWDFRRWLEDVDLGYYDNEYYTSNAATQSEGQILLGTEGGHYLEYFVDMNEDGRPEVFGNTKEHDQRLYLLLASQDSSGHLYVKKNNEYYENIGKYNQFFPGWDDAREYAGEKPESSKSGPFAYTEHRSKYLKMRDKANRLKSVASYSVSALMFNHVISAVDAIFATAKWNREHATRFSGQLLYSPTTAYGVSGVQISVAW
ncbi:hypothetical protein ACFL5M_05990 [Candidatus Neomarinimicrobiota bacterium]